MDIKNLLQQRADLEGDLRRVDASIGRLVDVEAGVDAAQTALDTFDANAAAAMLEWATSGAEGDGPDGDHLARTTLTRAVARAKASRTAAAGARSGLEHERAALLDQLQAASIKVDTIAFAMMADEHAALLQDFIIKTVPQVREELARLLSCREVMLGRVRELHAQGATAPANRIFQIVEKMELPADVLRTIAPTHLDLAKQTEAWGERQAEIIGVPTKRSVHPVRTEIVEERRRQALASIQERAKADVPFDHVSGTPKPGGPVVEHRGAA